MQAMHGLRLQELHRHRFPLFVILIQWPSVADCGACEDDLVERDLTSGRRGDAKRPSGGMADAQDLKSCLGLPKCGFESRLGY